MPAITIRDVPPHVRDELAARAARAGQSLQQYLAAHLREMVQTPSQDDVIRAIRERVRASGTRMTAQEVLAARDEGRR